MTRRRTVADDIREVWGIHDVVRYTPEQIECKGCGAPRAHGAQGKCDYCGRPT